MLVHNKKHATVPPSNKTNNFGKENGNDDLSYMVKESIGNVDFYKCKKCPYLALSMKDIKFHWQTVHIPSGLENKTKEDKSIRIKCPGCSGIFHLESSLMVHLRSHHKMAPKDIPKLVFSLLKEAERKKEYIEKLDVVIGNFKCEDQTPFEGTVIASVIEVPPDPIISENDLQIFNHDTYGGATQTLDLSNNEQYELNLNSAENSARQMLHPEGLMPQSSEEVFLFRGQHLINNTSVLEANLMPLDVISSVSEVKNTNAKKSPQKNKINNNVSKKNQTKIVKKSLPVKKGTLTISNNKNTISDEQNALLPVKQKCSVQGCSAKLVSDENMAYHISCHLNNTNELYCAECKKPVTSVESLHAHLWNQHKIDLEMQSCDQCSYKTFKVSRLNKIHKKIHSEVKVYTCEVCAKDFKNSKQLANHNISHRDTAPPRCPCDICHRDFKSRRYLLAHKRTVHQKEVSFYCEKCEYATATKHSLLLHSKSHSDDKPFECDQCTFKTAIRSSLRRHLQIHTQNRQYNCEHCAYSCIQTSSLKRHFLSKHPGVQFDRLHLCPICSYKTVNKDNFTVHMSTHTMDTPRKSIPHAARVEVLKPEGEESVSVKKLPPAKMENNEVINDVAVNSSHFFYSNTEGVEIMSDVENEKLDINLNTANTECRLNAEYNSSTLDKCITANLLHQEPDDLYYNLPEESDEISLVTKSIKDILNSAANKVKKTQMSQQCPSNTNIQTVNKNPTFPIILVKPKSQMCSEADNINSITLRSFTPQLLNIPLQSNHCEQNVNDNLPRKKPKISVKSNLILKGPDNVDSFNLQPQGKSRFSLLDLPFSTDEHNAMRYHTNSSQNDNVIPTSKLISRDPFMSDNSVLPNYLLTSNFFSNLHMPNISNDTLLIQASSDTSLNKSQNMRNSNSVSTPTETNQPSDLSDIKIENKPYIPPQSELSCTSLNDNASGSGSLIYEIPKHTIPIKFENKLDITGSYIYQDGLYQNNENALNQMQNVSIIEELPASFENSNGVINPHEDNPYSDNFVEMLDEDEIIVVDDTSCEMKSIPNFADDSNFGLRECEQFYNYQVQNMPVPLISNLEEGNNSGKHVKEKPRIISEVHIRSDKSKIMNFEAVKNLGLKLEFPSIQNIEWTLALLNDQHENKG